MEISLDATSYVSTHSYKISAEMSSFSLYKLFGMPTSVGGLIVKRSLLEDFKLNYFGGGSVQGWLPTEDYLKRDPVEQFSLGTEPYLEYASALIGLKTWLHLINGLQKLESWLENITTYALEKMKKVGIFKIYRSESQVYGPIIAFNVYRTTSDYYRPGDIFRVLESEKIQVRSGCFCNIGACMSQLELEPESIRRNFENGHSCGDEIDLDDTGKPQNALRISFGYHNSLEDIDRFINVFEELKNCPLKVEDANNNSTQMRISGLSVYPIKSCGPLKIDELKLINGLPENDRIFAVATAETNRILESKRYPKLSIVNVAKNHSGNLCIVDKDQQKVEIEVQSKSNSITNDVSCKSRLCLRKVDLVRVENQLANDRISCLIQENVKLLKITADSDGLNLQMKSPLLVVCTGSLLWLANLLQRETGIRLR